MPLDHDTPDREDDPASHDRHAVAPGSTEADATAVCAALQAYRAPDGPLLDLGCGTGRHLRALAGRGHRLVGLDHDPRMLAAARVAGVPDGCRLTEADAAAFTCPERFAAAILLNRSLTCFHSHRLATGLFACVAAHLRPGGLFLIDNCCTALWREVAAGNYGDGLSADGNEQMFFLPGENRFVYRRGPAVDADSWTPKAEDRIFRLWSLGEVALAAAGAGLALCRLASDSALIVIRRQE